MQNVMLGSPSTLEIALIQVSAQIENDRVNTRVITSSPVVKLTEHIINVPKTSRDD